MSIPIAQALYGIGVKGPQDRRRRQMEDEQFAQQGERHDMAMQQGKLGIQAAEQRMDQAETQFEWAQEDRDQIALARRAQEDLLEGLFKYELEQDPSHLVSAWSDYMRPVEGWNMVQTADGKPAIQLMFGEDEDGNAIPPRTLPVNSYTDKQGNPHVGMLDMAMGFAKGDPEVLANVRRQLLQGHAEGQAAAADRQFELDKITHSQREQTRRKITVESVKTQIEQQLSGSGIDRQEAAHINSFIFRAMGMDSDLIQIDDAKTQRAMAAGTAATQVLRNARERGIDMDLNMAAMIGFQVTGDGVTEEDARKMAEAEIPELDSGFFGVGGASSTEKAERDRAVEQRSAAIMAEARAAEAMVESLGGRSDLTRPVGERSGIAGASAGDDPDMPRQLGIGSQQQGPAQVEQDVSRGTSPDNPIHVDDLEGPPAEDTYVERDGRVFIFKDGKFSLVSQ